MKRRILTLSLAILLIINLSPIPSYATASTTLKLSLQKAALGVGEVFTFIATTNSKNTVKWTTSDKNTATVNNGKVTAKAEGPAVITASADGISKTINITVKKAPDSITATDITIEKSKSAAIEVKLSKGAASNELSYKSSNKSIAKVDKNGIVTGVKKGSCTITVTTFNGKSTTIKVTVTDIWDKINNRELLFGLAQPGVPMPIDMDISDLMIFIGFLLIF